MKSVCDTAENGAIAVQKVKENDCDAILMDVRMPVMNGLIATQKIREFNQTVPIICMSANVYKEDKIAAEEAGMNDFIVPLTLVKTMHFQCKALACTNVLEVRIKYEKWKP